VSDRDPFAHLGRPRRIWAIAACHGDVARLEALHRAIWERFGLGDRLIYLGNYLGAGAPAETIDALLSFRAALLGRPGMIPGDFVYLRGAQEEIWSKLLQIQFAPNPQEVLRWMLNRGAATTLEAYGGSAQAGLAASRDGAIAMARWTNRLREAIRQRPGHEKLMTVLQRAALTEDTGAGALLFVHAGLDSTRPLAAQGDSFWWGAAGFEQVTQSFETFSRIFRGFDPAGKGAQFDGYKVTLDGGCGMGGSLIGAAIAADGEILELLEA
jgi:hypothetical protein